LTVHGLAARVRLIVAAPLGYEASAVMPNEIEALVNYVVPGLGHMVRADKPRIRVWETQLSYQGFTAAFRRHTLVPDMDHQVSRWVLVMGKTLIDRKPYALGLALLADQDNTLNRITLEQPHQWMEALRVKQ
jgi:hypothetical protein